MSNVLTLALNEISLGRNVRLTDGENYNELVTSMRDEGQLVPIQVYRGVTGDFTIQHGDQRLKAAKELGWETIQATEVEVPDTYNDFLIMKTKENEARSPMSFIERADVYRQLIENGMRAKDVAERFGVTKSVVSISIATLNADPKLRRAVEDGRLAPSAVEPIIFQDAETQATLADAVISARTVRKVKSVVGTYQRAGIIPGVEVEETEFEEDPLLVIYREQLADAVHILNNIHPTWLESPDDFSQEDDFILVCNQWERILEECETNE